MPRDRRLSPLVVALSLAIATLHATHAPALVRGDAASAAAELPNTRAPFLTVTTTSTTASEFEDFARRPEYVVYPDGTFLVQKSDGKLWGTVLPRAELVELLRFVLDDAKFNDIDMSYLLSSPITTFTQFTLTTRSGTHAVRRRASGGLGRGVKDGERALADVEARLTSLAEKAQTPYTPGALFVVAKKTSASDSIPTWTENERVPFADLVAVADIERRTGVVVEGVHADAVRDELAKGPSWRFGTLAAEFLARPALPHERPASPPAPPASSDAVPAGPRPVAMGDSLPPPAAGPVAPSSPAPSPAPPPPPLPAPTSAPTPVPGPAPATSSSADWRTDDLDFAGVVKLFTDLNRKTSGSPHGKFWTKTYEEFVAYEFDSDAGKVRMLEPGKGQDSNLIRALEGRPMLVRAADGSVKEKEAARMPPKGAPMPAADIERLRRWIDHGAPREIPISSAVPATPPVSPAPLAPAPVPAPAPPSPAPAPVPAPVPTGGASDWTDDDVDFAGVVKLFTDLNRKTSGSPHGKFWTKSYEEFVAYEFDSDAGKVRMLEPGKGQDSNLIRALEGRPMLVRAADGSVKEKEAARMPPKGAPMPAADIAKLRRWIDHGAPKDRPAAGSTPAAAAPTSSLPPASVPVARPTGETRALTLVGTDASKLGTQGPQDTGRAPPSVYVARSSAEWDAIFATGLAASGPNGPRIAKALEMLKDLAKGYDFASSPLLLLVGPVTDNYAVEGTPTLELLEGGEARLVVRVVHDERTYVRAPDLIAWWAVYRIAGSCPARVRVESAPR